MLLRPLRPPRGVLHRRRGLLHPCRVHRGVHRHHAVLRRIVPGRHVLPVGRRTLRECFDCCVGECREGHCVDCIPSGGDGTCTEADDCCDGPCTDGTCCTPTGEPCTADRLLLYACSDFDHACFMPLVFEQCAENTQCCSGVCHPAGSKCCLPSGEVCTSDFECCSALSGSGSCQDGHCVDTPSQAHREKGYTVALLRTICDSPQNVARPCRRDLLGSIDAMPILTRAAAREGRNACAIPVQALPKGRQHLPPAGWHTPEQRWAVAICARRRHGCGAAPF